MNEMVFYGENKKLSPQYFKKAADFMLPLLLKPHEIEPIDIQLSVDPRDALRGASGSIINSGYDCKPPKSFLIWIRGSMAKYRQLRAFAHELVHLKQHVRGEIIPHGGPLCSGGTDPYWDDPNEIEAYGRERGLADRFRWSMMQLNHQSSA